MATQDVTLTLPEALLQRFIQMAAATRQPLTSLLLRAVEVGSPPSWEEAPVRFQVELAALDRLDDNTLWQVARGKGNTVEIARLEELLDKQSDAELTEAEKTELEKLKYEADRLMLRKAHAAALLRWRGHAIPPADKL